MADQESGVLNIDLDSLNAKELRSLKRDIDNAIESYRRRMSAKAFAEVCEVLEKYDLGFEDVIGVAKSKPTRKNPPKFRSPNDPTVTWSGRGRRPGWFEDAIAAGMSEDDMRIPRGA